MNKLFPIALALSTLTLSACGHTSTRDLQLQVAPNTAAAGSCGYVSPEPCLIVKFNAEGHAPNWQIWNLSSAIRGFTYEPGHLYDLTITETWSRGLIGDPPPPTYALKTVNSKVASNETRQPGDP